MDIDNEHVQKAITKLNGLLTERDVRNFVEHLKEIQPEMLKDFSEFSEKDKITVITAFEMTVGLFTKEPRYTEFVNWADYMVVTMKGYCHGFYETEDNFQDYDRDETEEYDRPSTWTDNDQDELDN